MCLKRPLNGIEEYSLQLLHGMMKNHCKNIETKLMNPRGPSCPVQYQDQDLTVNRLFGFTLMYIF